MMLISHRGNTSGPIPEKENSIEHISDALKLGFDVEVDVFYEHGDLFLGHNYPRYPVGVSFLNNPSIWCHAKTPDTLSCLRSIPSIHYFFHDNDTCTLTSRGHVWTFNGNLLPNTICVLPEKYFLPEQLRVCAGICSDSILTYKGYYATIDSHH